MCESMGAPAVVNPTHEYGDPLVLVSEEIYEELCADIEREPDSFTAPRAGEIASSQ